MKAEGGGGGWEDYKPAAGMVFIQVVAATMALINRAAMVKGMSPRVFIFYRQTVATLFIFFFALFSTRKGYSRFSVGLKAILLIFILALIGVTLNQNLYFEGLYLASSSAASAIANLVPAVTFLIASFFGLERVNVRRWSTIAKIVGTITCVGGAASIALLKGPNLLNDTWLPGCLFLFANSISWSLWLILQVPATAACPDHLSISLWTCLISTFQSGFVAFLFEPNWEAWNMTSTLELTCIFFSGIAGSGIQYIIQAWCISTRGPLYSALFNPLSTVIVTIMAAIFLHEHIFLGSLLGSVGVIAGLYVVLWGKSKEMEERKMEEENMVSHSKEVEDSCTNDLEQPLLAQLKCDP